MTPELIFESISVNYPFNDLVHSINYFAYQFRKVLSKDERYILRKAKDILFVHYDQTQIKKPLILSPCMIGIKLNYYPLELNEEQIQYLEFTILILEEKIDPRFRGRIKYYDF